MAGTGDIDHIQVIFFDETIQVYPGKCLAGIRTPVTEQPLFDVIRLQRLFQQWILYQVQHANAKVIAGTPVGIHLAQSFCRKRLSGTDLVGGRGGTAGGSSAAVRTHENLLSGMLLHRCEFLQFEFAFAMHIDYKFIFATAKTHLSSTLHGAQMPSPYHRKHTGLALSGDVRHGEFEIRRGLKVTGSPQW